MKSLKQKLIRKLKSGKLDYNQGNSNTSMGIGGQTVGAMPVKESQIQREFALLSSDVERLLGRISEIHQKIEPILRSNTPELARADKELAPVVGVAQEIYQNRLKILDGCGQLENMIDR